jgi:putative ABC transport system permease protein
MWRNYLTTGVRALLKNRTYAGITVLGLALGLAASMLILLFVRDQLSYDRSVPGGNDVYQLQETFVGLRGGQDVSQQGTPYATGPALVKDFPQIAAASYLQNTSAIAIERGQPLRTEMSLVGADYFKVFPQRFLQGTAATALRDANSIVVGERRARTLFGTIDAVGRTLTVLKRDQQVSYRVTAVVADPPRNSHNQASMFALFTPDRLSPGEEGSWDWTNGFSYVRLAPGTDVAPINAAMQAWADRNAPKETIDGKLVRQAEKATFRLVALPDIHLSGACCGPAGNGMDRSTIVTFSILAVLILFMACVNFTNLATARASQRAREVSLRKVLGATRRQLIAQFLIESLIVAALATLVALALVELTLPWLRRFLDAGIPLHYMSTDGILLPAFGLALLVGLVGGLYPAFYLTRFQPAQVLKANRSAADTPGSGRLRNALVISQFAISIGLIACTGIVYAQTRYTLSADPGFKRDGIIQVDNMTRAQVLPSLAALEQEIGRVKGVERVALTQIAMNTPQRSSTSLTQSGRPADTIGVYRVGYGFFETMGMRIVAGRALSRDRALDDATMIDDEASTRTLFNRGMSVVVTASALPKIGVSTPTAALGKTIGLGISGIDDIGQPATIVGVVADTRFRGVREPIDPAVYYHANANLGFMVVRFSDPDPAAVMTRIGAAWKRVIPNVPFEAQFADDAAAELYRADQALGTMFAGFAMLAVLIGCLGLFGLAAFTAERRTKEIGIRKVLGARTRDIVRLLVWQFSKPVLLANVIAWPLAFLAMRNWLNGFDDRITLTPVPFVLAGILALVIAVVTVAGHASRVASAKPITALRYE